MIVRHGLSVRMGSHFQIFTRELGRLTEKGETTFTAPLNDLSPGSTTGAKTMAFEDFRSG